MKPCTIPCDGCKKPVDLGSSISDVTESGCASYHRACAPKHAVEMRDAPYVHVGGGMWEKKGFHDHLIYRKARGEA